MPEFDDETTTPAPPEAVWKLLYDPLRFPEWWAGIATATTGDEGDVTFYPDGYPDFPMPQLVRTERHDRRVVVSCMVSDLVFSWQLSELDGQAGTRLAVHVEIPEKEAFRLETQQAVISDSLRRLAELAATDALPAPG